MILRYVKKRSGCYLVLGDEQPLGTAEKVGSRWVALDWQGNAVGVYASRALAALVLRSRIGQ